MNGFTVVLNEEVLGRLIGDCPLPATRRLLWARGGVAYDAVSQCSIGVNRVLVRISQAKRNLKIARGMEEYFTFDHKAKCLIRHTDAG